MRQKKIQAIGIICLLLLFGGFAPPILAYVMNSSSYRIQSDSINFYGGPSNSASYKLQETSGEVASGDSASNSYKIHAGFQQSPSTITISAINDVALMPPIPGVNGGTAYGNVPVTVTTDDIAGYTLQINATTTPALTAGPYSFADYTAAGANPDFSWSINSTDSEFGFSPEGTDIVQRYLDDGSSACNQAGGSDTPNRCWDALSQTPVTISQKTGSNSPGGTQTTVKFEAQSGASHFQPAGNYQVHIIMTAYIN